MLERGRLTATDKAWKEALSKGPYWVGLVFIRRSHRKDLHCWMHSASHLNTKYTEQSPSSTPSSLVDRWDLEIWFAVSFKQKIAQTFAGLRRKNDIFVPSSTMLQHRRGILCMSCPIVEHDRTWHMLQFFVCNIFSAVVTS